MKEESIQNYVFEKKREIRKVGTTYELVIETEQDFVIRRKTVRTSKIFAMIVSESTFYIKNENRDMVVPVTLQELNSFFHDLKEDVPFKLVTWIDRLNHDNLPIFNSIIENKWYSNICKENLYYNKWSLAQCLTFSELNKEILCQIIELTPKDFNFKYDAALFMERILSKYGKQHSDYFFKRYIMAPIESFYMGYMYGDHWNTQKAQAIHNLFELLATYKIDIDSFVEFLFFGTYRQGIFQLDYDFFDEYILYLSNQNVYYHALLDPFPEELYIKSHILSKKVKVTQSENYEELFATILREQQGHAFCSKNHSLTEIGVDALADRCFEVSIKIEACFQDIKNGVIPMELQTPDNYYLVFIKEVKILKIYGRNGAIPAKETMDWLEEWSTQKGIALECEVVA